MNHRSERQNKRGGQEMRIHRAGIARGACLFRQCGRLRVFLFVVGIGVSGWECTTRGRRFRRFMAPIGFGAKKRADLAISPEGIPELEEFRKDPRRQLLASGPA
jgi:hypothetical protein